MSEEKVGRGSLIGMATCYGRDGSKMESRWGPDFPLTSRPALGPTQPLVQWVPGLFPGSKRPERGFDHTVPSRTKVKERVDL